MSCVPMSNAYVQKLSEASKIQTAHKVAEGQIQKNFKNPTEDNKPFFELVNNSYRLSANYNGEAVRIYIEKESLK